MPKTRQKLVKAILDLVETVCDPKEYMMFVEILEDMWEDEIRKMVKMMDMAGVLAVEKPQVFNKFRHDIDSI